MSVDGKWNVVTKTPMGDQSSALELRSDGEVLTGNILSQAGTAAIYDGSVKGNELAWKVDITQPMKMTLVFTATVDAESIVGKTKVGMFGTMTFSGTRG